MAHEKLSELVDTNDYNGVVEYVKEIVCTVNFGIPAWVLIKTASYLRQAYDFEVANDLLRLSMPEMIPSTDADALTKAIDIQSSQNRLLAQQISHRHSKFDKVMELHKWLIYPEIFQRVDLAMQHGRGFSFVRLGDGEGNSLALKYAFYDNGIRDWSQKIIDLQFGESSLSLEDQFVISELVEESILSSDIIGVIQPAYLNDVILNKTWPADRQLYGNIYCLSYLVDHADRVKSCVGLTGSSIHKDPVFIDLVIERAKEAGFAGLIGPHPEVVNVLNKRGLHSIVYHSIPGEYKYFGPASNHFKDSFSFICDSINPPCNGALYLVGGGLLGKYYCHIIKERGGCAIDIGSAMDELAGYHNTRG